MRKRKWEKPMDLAEMCRLGREKLAVIEYYLEELEKIKVKLRLLGHHFPEEHPSLASAVAALTHPYPRPRRKRPNGVAMSLLRKAIADTKGSMHSMRTMAKAAHIPVETLQRIADGEEIPSLDTAEQIGFAVGKQWVLTPD